MAKLIQFAAEYLRDNNLGINYRPSSAVAAGTPTLVNGSWAISSVDVAANALGEFKLDGVFRARKANPATVMTAGVTSVDYSGGNFIVGSTFMVEADSPSGLETVDIRLTVGGGGGGGMGTTRKYGLEDVGDVSGAVSIDFRTNQSDNKKCKVTNDVTSWTLTFGAAGVYILAIEIGNAGSAIAQPANVVGDFILEDVQDAINYVVLMWDGATEATVLKVSLDE